MLLEFKTARNKNGNCKYLAIDTNVKIFSRNCPHMIASGIEIKTRDYNELIEKLQKLEFEEIERAF